MHLMLCCSISSDNLHTIVFVATARLEFKPQDTVYLLIRGAGGLHLISHLLGVDHIQSHQYSQGNLPLMKHPMKFVWQIYVQAIRGISGHPFLAHIWFFTKWPFYTLLISRPPPQQSCNFSSTSSAKVSAPLHPLQRR